MLLTFIHNAIRFATVFLFGSTGETITEKSGHLNMGIPGTMCFGALGGIIGESLYLSTLPNILHINQTLAVIIPIIFAMLFASIMGVIYSILTVSFRCNQNVTGLTITTFGVGLTNYFGSAINKTGFSIASKGFTKPVFAPATNWFSNIFLSYGILVYLSIFIAIVTLIVLKKTRVGLRLRSIGENPATADAAGINVTKYKYLATIVGSAIAGLGGLFYIMDYLTGSWEYTIDAMGWLAVALVIFSMWNPGWGIIGAILFGGLYIAPYYLMVDFAQQELLKMLPFAVTIIVLIIISIVDKKENQPPASLGVSYFREER